MNIDELRDAIQAGLGANITTIEGRPYLRYDVVPEKTSQEVCDEDYHEVQEFLRERGWEIDESYCEHDCLTGYLVECESSRSEEEA